MNRKIAEILTLVTVAASGFWGCGANHSGSAAVEPGTDFSYYRDAATQVEFTEPYRMVENDVLETPPPLTIDLDSPNYREITLDEAIQISLQQAKVIRDLGGSVLRFPQVARTAYDPAIQNLDPRFGVPAALSQYDAVFTGSATAAYNDRALNNQFFGGGVRQLTQDIGIIQGQVSKLTPTGTELIMRNITDYDANNAPGNLFSSAWTTQYEAEVRQKLLQGASSRFNMIAGPSNTPGVYNGVLLARVNTDISQTEFEAAIRDLVSDVENAYYDLYFAYRDLDARIKARDAALETWRSVNALYEARRRGGEADKEAQAREQYFRFQEQVQNSLTGRLQEGTKNNNGSGGGTFRGTGGVLVAERRLRYILNLPLSDGSLLRPSQEPTTAEIVYDWHAVLSEAMMRRVELRKQKWQIKSRELEYEASRDFLKPRFDIIGTYRWRGFGRDLLHQHADAAVGVGTSLTDGNARANSRVTNGRFNNAYDNLFDGDFQEWQLEAQLEIPLGFRQAHAAVKNAELRLARERAILREQEEVVALELSQSLSELRRAYTVLETNYNRRIAAQQYLEAVEVSFQADAATLDVLLEGQRRLADAESSYFRAVVEFAIANKNVHYDKGSLLDYNAVFLEESPWPYEAYEDSNEMKRLRSEPWRFNWLLQPGPVVSNGPAPQLSLPSGSSQASAGYSSVGSDQGTSIVPPAPVMEAPGVMTPGSGLPGSSTPPVVLPPTPDDGPYDGTTQPLESSPAPAPAATTNISVPAATGVQPGAGNVFKPTAASQPATSADATLFQLPVRAADDEPAY